MNLSKPISFTPPSITKKDGSTKTFNPITLNELDITIMDSAKRKIVLAQIRPVPRALVLWEKEAYDVAGDYTQAQVEARVLEILGNNPSKVLEDLFLPPKKTTNK